MSAIVKAPPATDALGRPLEIGWVSGSALSAAVRCAASGVLWRVLGAGSTPSRLGNALHDHLRQRNRWGLTTALEMLPELATKHELTGDDAELFYARARAFEWNPPKGAIAELPLCLFEDGSVRVVDGGRGQYDKLSADALIPAQIDLFWAEPHPLYQKDGRIICPPTSVLWVIDLKTGKEDYVEDAERNPQVLAGAVLAAKFTGAQRVMPAIVFMRKGRGRWDLPDQPLEIERLAKVEEVLVRAVHDVRRMRAAHRQGLQLVYRQGPHCNMCGARHLCPAHLATLKAWLSDPAPIEPGALTDAQVRKLAELAPSFRSFAKSVDDALRAHVKATGEPIALSDGRVFGPHVVPRTRYDVVAAKAALVAEVGADLADKAVRVTLTEAAMKKAIRAHQASRGVLRKGSEAWRRVYGRIARVDGVTKSAKVQWGSYKPSAQPLAEDQRLAVIAEIGGMPYDGEDEEEIDDDGDE